MKAARRVYIYLVSFISLVMMLLGAAQLLRLALEQLFGVEQGLYVGSNYLREQFSLAGAVTLVGAVVWGIHWYFAQRSVSPANPNADEERGSALRRLMIYAALFFTAWNLAFALVRLIQGTLISLQWLGTLQFRAIPDTLSATLGSLLVYGLACFYYWRVRNADNALTPEEGMSATVRRWYFYLASFVALSALIFSIADLGRYIWRTAAEGTSDWIVSEGWMPWQVANNVAIMGVALAAWLVHWRYVQRLTAGSREEQHSILRKVYLYGVLLQTVSVTLVSTVVFLYNLMRIFWGTSPLGDYSDSLLTGAGNAVVTALVYGAFWIYHWQVLRWQIEVVAYEPTAQASLRRIYHSLVALVALAVLASGLASMLRLLFDFWLGGEATGMLSGRAWGDQISLFAAMIIVGGPVWATTWLYLQGQAYAPDGVEHRQALSRRVYLYLVLFASIVALLSGGSFLVYWLLRNLGEPFEPGLVSQMSWALGVSITAGVLLAYHLTVLLGDQRARALISPPTYTAGETGPQLTRETAPSIAAGPLPAEPAGEHVAVLLLRSKDSADVAPALEALQEHLPEGFELDVLPPSGVTPAELPSWLAFHPPLPTPGAGPTPTAPAPPMPPSDQSARSTPVSV
jgi:hypothetical protein